jgi:hypothetical protein
MHQQELLSTEAERMRRLKEVPEITADTEQEGHETELEIAASNSSQENRGENEIHQNFLLKKLFLSIYFTFIIPKLLPLDPILTRECHTQLV